MPEITRILSAIERGDPHAAEQLLPLVYDELRQLGAQKMARESLGQTLQPTALGHEGLSRLVKWGQGSQWGRRRQFFWAGAEGMRPIPVEPARRKGALKRGGDRSRMDLEQIAVPGEERSLQLL